MNFILITTQIILYIICYAFIIKALKSFVTYALYSYFGIEVKATIIDVESKKTFYGTKYIHSYKYKVGDGITREGKLTKHKSEFEVDDELEVSYVKNYPDLSHYPQQSQELIATLSYSLVGLIMLYRVSKFF